MLFSGLKSETQFEASQEIIESKKEKSVTPSSPSAALVLGKLRSKFNAKVSENLEKLDNLFTAEQQKMFKK